VDVTVVVGTYGGEYWSALALQRAIPSATRAGVKVVHCHAGTLHDARNGGLEQVDTQWVCHLDADDELEAGYFEAMDTGTADVRAPAVRYVRGGSAQWPAMPHVAGHTHDCTAQCLTQGNWLVVGAVARTALVRDVGGWRDFAWSEDWDLWLRLHLAGATFEALPAAVYRAHVRPNSRNRSASHATRMAAHRAIEAANGIGAGA
jgi:GT2 family glycosyltransferase